MSKVMELLDDLEDMEKLCLTYKAKVSQIHTELKGCQFEGSG